MSMFRLPPALAHALAGVTLVAALAVPASVYV